MQYKTVAIVLLTLIVVTVISAVALVSYLFLARAPAQKDVLLSDRGEVIAEIDLTPSPYTPDASPRAQWLRYANDELGFTVEYPPSWTNKGVGPMGESGTGIAFTYPEEPPLDAWVAIGVFPLNYSYKLISQLTQTGVSVREAAFNGYKGYWIFPENNPEQTIYIPHGEKAYEVVAVGYNNKQVREILGSFQIMGK